MLSVQSTSVCIRDLQFERLHMMTAETSTMRATLVFCTALAHGTGMQPDTEPIELFIIVGSVIA